jgi:hypothetical protein
MLRRNALRVLCAVLICTIFLPTPDASAERDGTAFKLTIEAVWVDRLEPDGSGFITIEGDNLIYGRSHFRPHPRRDPIVTLGDVHLSVNYADDELIIAELPALIPDGDYLLTVSTGKSQNQHDEYDLSVGATGPVGAQGDEGPQGETGDTGPGGPVGPQGERGIEGDMGPIGPDGLEGPRGFSGPAGSVGPAGPDGPEGPQGEPGEPASPLPLAVNMVEYISFTAGPAPVFGETQVNESYICDGCGSVVYWRQHGSDPWLTTVESFVVNYEDVANDCENARSLLRVRLRNYDVFFSKTVSFDVMCVR